MNTPLPESQLQRDLRSGQRDATYRAMSYIAGHGGPPIAGAAVSLAELEAQRAGMLAWLQAQADVPALAREYLHYCERWSPIWKD